jgi:hypothetical protein
MLQLSLPCKAAANVCPTLNEGYDRSRNTYIYMRSNLETIEVSKVRDAAPAPQISAMPSSMAADPTKQEVFRGEKRNKFNKAKVSDWRHMENICVFQSVVLARF